MIWGLGLWVYSPVVNQTVVCSQSNKNNDDGIDDVLLLQLNEAGSQLSILIISFGSPMLLYHVRQ